MLNNVPEISVTEYEELCDFAIETESNLIIIGSPGMGKSEIPAQRAARANRKHNRLDLSVMEAPDLVGNPVADRLTKTTEYYAPDTLPVDDGQDRHVLVLDELDKALPELQNPTLGLFDSRRINSRKVAVGAIIATANKPTDGAYSKPISKALTNRCMVFVLKEDPEAWFNYASDRQLNPIVYGFLSKNPEWLYRSNSESEKSSSDPFEYNKPSPRAWTNAANFLDKLVSRNFSSQQAQRLTAGYVGESAATTFRVWIDYFSNVDPIIESVLSGACVEWPSDWDDTTRFFASLYMMTKMHRIATTAVQSKKPFDVHIVNRGFSWLKTGAEYRPDQLFAAYKCANRGRTGLDKRVSNLMTQSNDYNIFVKDMLNHFGP